MPTKEEQDQVFRQGKRIHPRDVTAGQFVEKALGYVPVDESVRGKQNRDFVSQEVNIDPESWKGKQNRVFFQNNLPDPESNAGRQAEAFLGRIPNKNQLNEQAQVFLGGGNRG